MQQEKSQTQLHTVETPSEPVKQFVTSAAFWTAVNPVINGMAGMFNKTGFTKNFMESVTTRAGWAGNLTWGATMGVISMALDAIFRPKHQVVVIHHLPHAPKEVEAVVCEEGKPKSAFAEKEAQRREIPESQQATR